jgi:hypothetical protein
MDTAVFDGDAFATTDRAFPSGHFAELPAPLTADIGTVRKLIVDPLSHGQSI